MTSLMEIGIRSGDFESVANQCKTVTKAAQQMSRLIDALHEYTQLEPGVSFQPVAMTEVIKISLLNLEHTIQEHRALVTYAELPTIFGNSPELIQLLQNLLANGIKYCDTVPVIQVTAESLPDKWLFSVKDNGIGIPERYQKHVFEPFKRFCDKGKYEGTGLGLATCKKIVERHHGSIWCESTEGVGTTMFFTLPATGDEWSQGFEEGTQKLRSANHRNRRDHRDRSDLGQSLQLPVVARLDFRE
jgi:light-regulated signal transduction histidine kinase (bacteriophytochrome)